MREASPGYSRRPAWLKTKLPGGDDYGSVTRAVRGEELHTVCRSARCPNLGECWGRGTATFMILGNACTRRCGFCAVGAGEPEPHDLHEAERVARAVKRLGIRHAVVTSVTRDDLEDGGSELFARVIRRIRALRPGTTVEVLIPDFGGEEEALSRVLAAEPEVLAHNLETVPRLYPSVRPAADYERSLGVLAHAHEAAPSMLTKTGLMLGLGESRDEVEEVMRDLPRRGVDILTLGQYLQPTREHLPVTRFLPPEEFEDLAERGRRLGLGWVEAGPLVRSSYRAEEVLGRLAHGVK